ncbi:PTS sugar transporter subunit IIA [Lactobacillus acetotolerans]|uniref:PTS sugar transporter subunit IIA n=1 Tax=Lactobacillus acetotolerans TaxID=1600 RepID=UPI0019D121D0|nr:PTS sugar transporter subunit IIA [Lactobacillus acetotolerans]MBN7276396.1 PTS sugar transporter subunit IIA [Lactobacillus acetotolerans]
MTDINYKEMLHEDTIFLTIDANDRDDLFEQIAERLNKLGYVKDSYAEALKKREDEFPTGLVTKYLSIALPHVDPENINKPFIAAVKNIKPIHMLQMGSNEDMKAQYFFFLGITDSSHQVVLLQKFMLLLRNKNFADELTSQTDPKKMFEFLKKAFLS